jgi:hypothetical protein
MEQIRKRDQSPHANWLMKMYGEEAQIPLDERHFHGLKHQALWQTHSGRLIAGQKAKGPTVNRSSRRKVWVALNRYQKRVYPMEAIENDGKFVPKAAPCGGRKEFKTFWSPHRWLVTIVMLLAPVGFQIASHGVRSVLNMAETIESGLIGLAVSLIGNYFIAMWKAAETLDAESRSELATTRARLEAESQRVVVLTSEIAALRAPKRTSKQEHDYNHAKQALEPIGEKGRIALQFLMTHEKLSFGFYDPPVTFPMPTQELRDILRTASDNGLVTIRHERLHPMEPQMVYEIAPGMKAALEELLHPPPT